MIGSKRTTKLLVLGNDPQINQIDFGRLAPDVKTLGVNRIWLKYIPDYFFFHDIVILTELERNPELLARVQSQSFCFSSDWLKHNLKRTIPNWVHVYNRRNKTFFPDSVTTAMNLFSSNVMSGNNVVYYMAGISLNWSQKSHFWKEMEYDSLNRHDHDWYSTRFEKMFNNFRTLKARGFKMVSVNPNSRLNKICRYENIENLYVK